VPEEPTTPDLEEAIRRLTEAANRRDFDAGLAMYSQDAVVDNTPIGAGVFEGREAIRGFLKTGPYPTTTSSKRWRRSAISATA